MKCPLCAHIQTKPLYQTLLKCTNCSLVRAEDHFFKVNPSQIYNKDYFSGIDYADYQSEKNALSANFRNRLKIIKKYKKSGKLLEVGCAYGYFLALAQSSFDTEGIDLDKQVTAIAKQNSPKSTIHTGDLLNLRPKSQQFDIVCLFDVIEHLKEPKKYLKKTNQLLNHKGYLFIETGNIGAPLPKIQKGRWRLITPPTHLFYFDSQTITKLLNKTGFRVLSIKHVPFNRTIKQTLYRLSRNPSLLKSSNKLLNISFPIQTFDLMFIIAKKP